jgi:hypothetical protein
MATLINTVSILKTPVGIYVYSDGTFTARLPTKSDEAPVVLASGVPTYEGAVRAARKKLKEKQVRVAVPFTTSDLQPAIARGRHASRPDYILTWVDDGSEKGKSEEIYAPHWGTTYSHVLEPNLTEKDLERIKYLFEHRAKVHARLDKVNSLIGEWNRAHSFQLSTAVDAAIKEATAPPVDSSKGSGATYD